MEDPSKIERDAAGKVVIRTPYRGQALISQGLLNQGSAFTSADRQAFGLEGLLPAVVTTLEQQVERAYRSVCRKDDPLERYIGLAALQDRNEVLFYRLLLEHVDEFMPIVYTPTVGDACREYSAIFRRGRGLWITPDDQGRIDEVLGNAPRHDIKLVVVTDNERILGLGDQGAGGIGIPIGKLSLYTMAAGIHPAHTLPISLDVGTDNEELLNNPLYIGYRKPRLRGERYQELVAEFVQAVKTRFPSTLLQWEDFKKANAFGLLERYKKELPSFNDDIQGTAGVALAGVLAACRGMGRPLEKQRVVTLGAGAAGVGIARQLRDAFARAGLEGDALTEAICLMDSRGALVDGREVGDAHKREFVWPAALAKKNGLPADGAVDLLGVVSALKPTVLIGTSGEPGHFSEAVVREMAKHHDQIAVFPFSNPTSKSEGRPADIIPWSDGKAWVATGSPFEPVQHGGRTIRIGQGNNVYIFPGVGLGLPGGAGPRGDRLDVHRRRPGARRQRLRRGPLVRLALSAAQRATSRHGPDRRSRRTRGARLGGRPEPERRQDPEDRRPRDVGARVPEARADLSYSTLRSRYQRAASASDCESGRGR